MEAEYYGPNGEQCFARQMDEDDTTNNLKKTDWIVRGHGGNPLPMACDDVFFKSAFRQKYPRPVGRDRDLPPAPEEKRSA